MKNFLVIIAVILIAVLTGSWIFDIVGWVINLFIKLLQLLLTVLNWLSKTFNWFGWNHGIF